ncbi:MAG: tyrosine-type recombinase/integrase [Candidatus Thermoplasmatota archaeon]
MYESNLAVFFEYLEKNNPKYKNPDSYLIDIRNITDLKKRNKICDFYVTDILKFMDYLNKEKYSPKSKHNKLSTIKKLFIVNYIDLPAVDWEDAYKKCKGNARVSSDYIPSTEEMQRILQHGTVKSRALFLMMLSSGMRASECCNIRIKDITFGSPEKNEASIIRIPVADVGTKNECNNVTFMTPEATKAVQEWINVRDEFIKTKSRYSEKHPEGDRLFPFRSLNAQFMFNLMCKKAGFNTKKTTTGRDFHKQTIHMHCLRKYFASHLNDDNLSEALMNHSANLISTYKNAYSDNHVLENLKNTYESKMQTLFIYELPVNEPEIKKQSDEIEKLREQLKNHQQNIESLVQNKVQEIVNQVLNNYTK